MPWSNIEDVPDQVKTHNGIPLTLKQANKWAEIYDALVKQKVENPAAIAWSTWSKVYEPNPDKTGYVKSKGPVT